MKQLPVLPPEAYGKWGGWIAERVLELVYTADILDAAQAREIGLVREVVAPEELLPTAYALAERFVRLFSGFDAVVAPSASCVSMVRNHYRELLGVRPDLDGDPEQIRIRDAQTCAGCETKPCVVCCPAGCWRIENGKIDLAQAESILAK